MLNIRFIIAAALLLRFPPHEHPEILLVLVVYALCSLGLLYIPEKLHLAQTAPNSYVIAQIVVDICVFSFLYWSTGNADSDVFLLYVVPLLLSAEYLRQRDINLAFVLLTGIFLALVIVLPSATHSELSAKVFRIFLPRWAFFLLVVFISIIRMAVLRSINTELKNRNRERDMLIQFLETSSKLLGEEKLLKAVIETAVSNFGAYGAHIRILDGNQLRLAAITTSYQQIVEDVDLTNLNLPAFIRAFQEESAYVVDDIEDDDYFQNLLGRDLDQIAAEELSQIRSFGCFPLVFEGRRLGLLTLAFGERRALTDPRIYMSIAEFAEHAAAALHRSRESEKMVRQTRELGMFVEAAQRISLESATHLQYQVVLSVALRLLDVEHGTVYLVSDRRDRLTPITSEPSVPALDAFEVPLGSGVAGTVAQTRAPLMVNERGTVVVDRSSLETDNKILAVPLLFDGDVIGVISVMTSSPDRRDFTANDSDTLKNYAAIVSQVVSPLHRMKNENRLRQAAANISSFPISSNLRFLFNAVLTELSTVVHFDSASLQLLANAHHYPTDLAKTYLEIVAGQGFDNDQDVMKLRFKLTDERPNGPVMKNKLPLRIENLAEDYKHIMSTVGIDGVRAWMGVPLIWQNMIFGMIALDRKAEVTPFTAEEERLAFAFSMHAAITINGFLQYNRRDAYKRMTRSLYELQNYTAKIFDLAPILKTIAMQAYFIGEQLGLRHEGFSSVTLVAGNAMKLGAVYTPNSPHLADPEELSPVLFNVHTSPSTVIERIVTTKTAISIDDVTRERDPFKLFGDDEAGSLLAVPLLLLNQVIGVISVYHPQNYYFDLQRSTELQNFASQVTLVLRAARLIQSRLALTTMTIPMWSDQHSIWRARLDALDIIDNLSRQSPSEVNTGLELLHEIVNGMPAREKFTLPLNAYRTEQIELNTYILEVVKANKSCHGIQISYNVPKNVFVSANREWLAEAFNNVLNNAVRQMETRFGHRRKLEISVTHSRDNGVEIVFTGNGASMRPDILFKLFNEPIEQEDHVSLGAFISAQIIGAFGGYIGVKSTNELETSIAIWLPLST